MGAVKVMRKGLTMMGPVMVNELARRQSMNDRSGNPNSWFETREMIEAWDDYNKKTLIRFIMPVKGGTNILVLITQKYFITEND